MEWWVAGRRRSVAASARDPEPLRHTCNPSLKVTFDLKTQLRELARCGGPVQDDPLVAALVAPPVVDVRLTAWLLRPSAWEVVDGEVDAKPRAGAAPRTLAGLAARYDGSVAAVDAGLPGLEPGGGRGSRRGTVARAAALALQVHERQEAELNGLEARCCVG